MKSNIFDNEEDLLLSKALIDLAQEEGIDVDDKNITTISEKGVEMSVKATEAMKEINRVLDIKRKLFSEVNIDELTSDEYESKLSEFHDSIDLNFTENKIDKIKERYSNINFDNLDEQIPKLILSGDNIYENTLKEFGPEWDYSPVMMQWCRAVELELRKKIYIFLDNFEIKKDISDECYRRNGEKLNIDHMMGCYGAMKKYKMVDYIYDKYLANKYSNFSKQEFLKMIDYIKIVNKYRRNSAHPEANIELDKSSADNCKEYITASKKILEVLSYLKSS